MLRSHISGHLTLSMFKALLSWMYCDVFCMLSLLDVFKDLASSALDGYIKGDVFCLILALLVYFNSNA